jgi:hypothetical protein
VACAEIDWSKIFQEIESIERREDMRYINSVQRMYMEKFRAEGVVTGEVKLLKKLLEKRFGSLPTWVIDKLENAAEQELESWGESILTAETLNAVFDTFDTDTTH